MPTPRFRRAAASLILVTLAAPLVAAAEDPLDAVVDVDVKQAPVAGFLDTLSTQSGVSFALADGLEGKRVPAREALELVLELKDLDCIKEPSGAWLVAPVSRR